MNKRTVYRMTDLEAQVLRNMVEEFGAKDLIDMIHVYEAEILEDADDGLAIGDIWCEEEEGAEAPGFDNPGRNAEHFDRGKAEREPNE